MYITDVTYFITLLEYSFLMAPAVCLNGMGGVVYVFTSFQVPNLFENIRSTMISLMIGSYSASAIVYMLFKVMYISHEM